ncbi:Uncharacterised protein [Mycobacteroides abscessus subsp. abscessus]|nr:Uncharacterised protein [Mycobacteroides abscessus subsp. abscessus]
MPGRFSSFESIRALSSSPASVIDEPFELSEYSGVSTSTAEAKAAWSVVRGIAVEAVEAKVMMLRRAPGSCSASASMSSLTPSMRGVVPS